MAWEQRTEEQIGWDEVQQNNMGRLLYHLDTREGLLDSVEMRFTQGEKKHSDVLYKTKVNQSWLQRIDGFLHIRVW